MSTATYIYATFEHHSTLPIVKVRHGPNEQKKMTLIASRHASLLLPNLRRFMPRFHYLVQRVTEERTHCIQRGLNEPPTFKFAPG